MKEVIQKFKESIDDNVFTSSEKKDLKQLIVEKVLTEREMDFLRSQIFDIARENQDHLSKESLINWIEETNKLTLISSEPANIALAYFSPGQACKSAIITQLRAAISSIKICVFTISDNDISTEILSAHNRGIGVKILTDNDKSFDRGSDIEMLHNNNVSIKIDSTEHHMHHKFCIIDKKTLLTGSYNWTRSAADRNQENILVTQNPFLVKSFLGEFEKLSDQLIDY
ncbi:DUF1669 domain-containing protein [Cryomorpha ignava]|uniref:phospholipase D n=1 Tax=Cryomorpha ignava TaxID=101383 RepID=A0A7K3WWD0_9FLAO|nr:phospholipase D-like domain-containing protein [Cryomorpha ignava]NEN25351.1 DUF1669 domain-containing protein [Cryomorpha ignava]